MACSFLFKSLHARKLPFYAHAFFFDKLAKPHGNSEFRIPNSEFRSPVCFAAKQSPIELPWPSAP